MNLKNHSRITRWGVWCNFWFPPSIGIGLKLKERLVADRLQVYNGQDYLRARWMQVERGLLDIHLPCRELLSNTKGETLLYFKLPGGTMTLLSAHNLPRCGLEAPFEAMTVTRLMRAQIFLSDNEMKLKQLVPICSAIFRLLLYGGAHWKSFAKTYLLAKCFTILCCVHDNRYVSKRLAGERPR
jgi:hypothetical protein